MVLVQDAAPPGPGAIQDKVGPVTGGYTIQPGERLSNWRLFIFSLSGMPLALIALPLAFFLPAFMTGELGLSLSTWALITLCSRIWDIGMDPVVGVVSDLLPSKWGRRRHWLAIGMPVVLAGTVLLCMPRFFIQHMTFLYALVAMCIMQVGITITGLNAQAWGAELSADYHERSRILGWRAIVAALAPLFAFGIPIIIERFDPHPTNGEKLFFLAAAVIVLLPILTLLALIFVPEAASPVRAKPKHERMKFLKSWLQVFKNKNMVRLIVIDILAAMPFSVSTAISAFYVTYVLDAPRMVSSLLLCAFAGGLLSMPIWIWTSKHFEKHKLMAFATIGAACISATQVLWGPGDALKFGICVTVLGVFTSGPGFLLRSMVADVVDSDTLETGEQRTGAFFALVEMTQKFAPTIGVMLVFPYLQWLGFDPSGHHNTPEGIAALKYVFAIFPPIPMVIVAWLLFTFPLGKKEQVELRRKIHEVHGQDAKTL
jgi:Na+/melibiose symporter-like transporter